MCVYIAIIYYIFYIKNKIVVMSYYLIWYIYNMINILFKRAKYK